MICSDGRGERELGARLARPHAGPRKREEERRNDGRLDQWPLATGDDENVAASERLSGRDLLADQLRPPVCEPEDERGAERGRRHDARVLPGLEGDADHRGHEERAVDGCSEPDVGGTRLGHGAHALPGGRRDSAPAAGGFVVLAVGRAPHPCVTGFVGVGRGKRSRTSATSVRSSSANPICIAPRTMM